MSLARIFVERAPERVKKIFTSIELFPIVRTLRGYNTSSWRRDLRAGLNVALVAFPQGIAYAMIAGIPISYGLFGMIVACLIGPLFAGSRFIIAGPTNATAVLLLSASIASGESELVKVALLPLLLIMVGALQVIAGYLNIGSLIAYISRSVIVGYLTAAAVLIIANQAPAAFGFPAPEGVTLFGALREDVVRLAAAKWETIVISATTAAIYLSLRRFAPKLPHAALTLVASIGLGFAAEKIGLPIVTLPSFSISNWSVTLPVFDFASIHQLASAALAIAFLGILESASISKTLAAQAGERLDTNQEVFALGMANFGCAFLGGMPASGSPTRSVLSVSSGCATPAASLVCGAVSLALVLGLGALIGHVPRASLAIVVVFVSLSLINLRQIRFVVRSTRADAVVFAITAGSALVFPLDSAIFLGTAMSIVLFLRQAGEPELVEYAFSDEGVLAAVAAGERRPLPEISIVHVEGSLFFGASELLQEQIRRACEDPNLRIIILRLKFAQHLDASAILALEELVQFMRENGRGLIVSGARKDVFRICKRTGLVDLIGRENFFIEWPQNPTLSTRNALKRAQQILGQKEAAVRVFGETRMKTE